MNKWAQEFFFTSRVVRIPALGCEYCVTFKFVLLDKEITEISSRHLSEGKHCEEKLVSLLRIKQSRDYEPTKNVPHGVSSPHGGCNNGAHSEAPRRIIVCCYSGGKTFYHAIFHGRASDYHSLSSFTKVRWINLKF